ncbi:hypothetical protein KAI87_11040 [Myxococcota bacterium]|nr:hypothetical protein [Myxococcota bacterium]
MVASWRTEIDNAWFLKPIVALHNVLNAYQDDFDTGANRDAGYVYGPRLPRTLYLGMQMGLL